MTQELVKTDVNNQIAKISFYSEKANALSKNMLSEICTHIDKFGKDKNCKVILICSEGEKTFCAGASFQEFQKVTNLKNATEYLMGFGNLILTIKNCPKLVVTKVHGKVVGGGIGLIAASDYSIASTDASIKLSEVALGIGPFVIEPALRRKMGVANTMHMTFDTEWRSAEWALNSGLYAKLVDSKKDLDKTTNAYLEFISEKQTESLSELKKIFWKGYENLDKELKIRATATAKFVLEYFD